jgi:hypothetical protein
MLSLMKLLNVHALALPALPQKMCPFFCFLVYKKCCDKTVGIVAVQIQRRNAVLLHAYDKHKAAEEHHGPS